MSYVLVFTHCLIGVVFLASGLSKLGGRRRFREFASSVADLRLLPERLVTPVAAAVAVGELAVPALLVAASARSLPVAALTLAALALAGVLLSAFTVAIVVVLHRGTPASCRCFGGGTAAPFGWHHVARNAALALVAGLGVHAALRSPILDPQVVLLGAPPALVAALVIVRLDDIAELFTPLSKAR
ncbi:MauE/DoxX family redox-associated membrane protein [Micromonospora sp. NPDC049559]|uniref:MauE/DoxX family redox-associated membrane protein n=1 Tax=Micromonospora sp. NPDC049559 TaxID=3155923 RepID=UPI003420EA92